MSFAPKTIPFNIIDRSYLIAETPDANGNYFPMSPIKIVKLKMPVSSDEVLAALMRLVETHPSLRLAYKLDYHTIRWERVPEADLANYLAACVHTLSDDCPIETHLAAAIAVNNTPLSQPINLFIAGDYLLIRMHHSFGDGKYLCLLMALILAELFGQTGETSTLAYVWWKPLWHIIWQNIGQGSYILWQFVKSLFSYYQDYQQDTQQNTGNEREPIQSASPMVVRFKTISAECMTLLNEARADISLNTLLQVMVGEKLNQLNIQQNPITYTIPVDLRRYLPDADAYYPGNLSSQIRVTLPATHSLIERCKMLQKQISEQLKNNAPLVGIVGEWLLALSGSKTYQSVNRDWLLKSTHNDPRVFVLSNLGNLDGFFAPFQDYLADDFAPQIVIPLMGSPALVFCFNTLHRQGNIVVTYDPQLFSDEQLNDILSVFGATNIQHIVQQLRLTTS